MATLRTTSASCLGCVARRSLASAAARPTATTMTTTAAANPFLTIQTRGKKQYRTPDGVVVRLLEDVTRFGRKDTILRVARGRMRNMWYPEGTAEYVTAARLAELGVKNIADAVVPADTTFVARDRNADALLGAAQDAAVPARPSIALRTVTAARAATLLETLLPAKLEFYRKPISADALDIFGSVSADDVATALREVLRASQADEDVMLLRIEARDVRFIIPADEASSPTDAAATTTTPAPAPSEPEDASTADRVKSLGRWEVEITVRGSHGGGSGSGGAGSDSLASAAASASLGGSSVPPIRRTVFVKAQQD